MSCEQGWECSICSDAIAQTSGGGASCGSCSPSQASDDVASCGSCSQRFHLNCLREALSVDSRCPLCREEVARVGYSDGNNTIYPESRRLFGNLDEVVANYESQLERMTWARSFLTDMGEISNSMVQLLRRVQKMMANASRKKGNGILREARALLADIGEVGRKAEGLRARYENRTGLPDDFEHSAESIFQRLGPLIQSLNSTVQRYTDIARSKLSAVERQSSSSESSQQSGHQPQQPTPVQTEAVRSPRVTAAKKICRRPAAPALKVRRRPAAASAPKRMEAEHSKKARAALEREDVKNNDRDFAAFMKR